MRITMTYELAMAAAQDAANDQMRKAGRDRWNEDDWDLACEVVEQLFVRHLLAEEGGNHGGR